MLLRGLGHGDEVEDGEAYAPDVIFEVEEGFNAPVAGTSGRCYAEGDLAVEGFELSFNLAAAESIKKELGGLAQVSLVDGDGEYGGVRGVYLVAERLELVIYDADSLFAAFSPAPIAGYAGLYCGLVQVHKLDCGSLRFSASEYHLRRLSRQAVSVRAELYRDYLHR
jgi:hypothetical protein